MSRIAVTADRPEPRPVVPARPACHLQRPQPRAGTAAAQHELRAGDLDAHRPKRASLVKLATFVQACAMKSTPHSPQARRLLYIPIVLLACMSGFVLAASPPPDISDEAARLVAQPIAGFEDTCEEQGTARVRRVRFATLDASGRREAELELRTTSGEAGDVLEYLVGGVVVFTHRSGEEPQIVEAGHLLLANEAQATKILAAFAAAHPRIFANDVDTPGQACGPLRGKPEQLAKCGAIGALGVAGGPVVAFFSGCAAILCYYAVEKACEGNPDSCQPGWTEG